MEQEGEDGTTNEVRASPHAPTDPQYSETEDLANHLEGNGSDKKDDDCDIDILQKMQKKPLHFIGQKQSQHQISSIPHGISSSSFFPLPNADSLSTSQFADTITPIDHEPSST